MSILTEAAQYLAAASPEQKTLLWETTKALTVAKGKRRFLTVRSFAAITRARASTWSTARGAEIRWCQCKHLPSRSNARRCQGCPCFRGIFGKRRTPHEEGSHCHSYRLKDLPFSSDTAASLGLNSDLL